MMDIGLIGQLDTKRTEYFLKAAEQIKQPVSFYNILECDTNCLKDIIVKVDPLQYNISNIDQLDNLISKYIDFLLKLETNKNIKFLNQPSDIILSLDKFKCKQLLAKNNINITPIVAYNIRNLDELNEFLLEKKIFQVFIKPQFGSGAAGVIAYRFSPKTNKQIIYTSAKIYEGRLINTKDIIKIEDKLLSQQIINSVLSNANIIEQWLPKANYMGMCYDLRVVYQFGAVHCIVPRQSKNPITNLHLNNMAFDFKDLNLSSNIVEQITNLCHSTMKLFKGLNYSGIDILLHKNSLKPYIIEINGQGDLIYQDIFNKNSIYKHQIIEMEKCRCI